jgi:geranylgeranyl diphosphate synthase type I
VSLQKVFDGLLPQIEAELQEIVRIPDHSLGAYYGMMQYHLGWTDEALRPIQTNSGKRLRPILCLLSCQALDGKLEQALPAAGSVELIHNFSLVHDDIQDASHTRRGRRAVWDIWGMAQGINVGDGLFVLAQLALHPAQDGSIAGHLSKIGRSHRHRRRRPDCPLLQFWREPGNGLSDSG